MEFINENGFLIIIIITLILTAIAVYNIVNIVLLNKKLSMRKVSFKTIQEKNVQTGAGDIAVITVNKSMTDLSLSAIGVVCANKYYDFIKEYGVTENIVGDKVLVSQRSSVKLQLPVALIEDTFIVPGVYKRFGKIRVYAIDKSGTLSRGGARSIKIMLNRKIKQLKQQKQQEEKERNEAKRRAAKEEFLKQYTLKTQNKEKTTLKEKIKAFIYNRFFK